MIPSLPLPAQMCQTVTRVRLTQTGEDDYGNPTTTASSADLTGCMLAPLQGSPYSESQGADFDRVVMSYKLYLPGAADINTDDRIQQGTNRLAGVSAGNPAVLDLQVYGIPAVWPNVDGSTHHVECVLKRYGG